MFNESEIRAEFLAAIEKFILEKGLAPSTFGRMACRDQNLVFDLREGKHTPTLKRMQKVYAYMAEFEAKRDSAA